MFLFVDKDRSHNKFVVRDNSIFNHTPGINVSTAAGAIIILEQASASLNPSIYPVPPQPSNHKAMSDYIVQTQQQASAKLAVLRYTGLSYLANTRNIEAPWYAEMLERMNTVLSGVPNTVLAPQFPVNVMVELDEGGDVEMEVEESGYEGDGGEDGGDNSPAAEPAADLDVSVETITIPVDVEKVPDFCIIASDCRPDNANDGRLKTYFLGHKIKKNTGTY
ncbi:uncharacterized protein PHACADRAFT_214633 [Phanerochaete carnosa HHB-10118-sp]|uniref:Uncharacterized protein n=1 Tax=Phanerochaete carnosa (strain HHB-10118-sp) TaxID=650164 RepID=K5VQL1_PHACS|nr:uncharacterized protein PHACADRAFT_214633 [Phanerochaete carnosa HHB-10118-sp]EKM48844.1 hypothetical protein PHACADRAFT_214633 [Phanerochaete carnosa HHB-10118-sp]